MDTTETYWPRGVFIARSFRFLGSTPAATDHNHIPAVTLTANNTSGIPVLGTTYALGVTLSETPDLVMTRLRPAQNSPSFRSPQSLG
jgi:hypothetical protein